MLSQFKQQLKDKQEVYLRIKVRPNASETEIKEILEDETIKINISSPPVKNKANTELIKFLAQEFKIHKDNIKIISGKSDSLKLIKISQ